MVKVKNTAASNSSSYPPISTVPGSLATSLSLVVLRLLLSQIKKNDKMSQKSEDFDFDLSNMDDMDMDLNLDDIDLGMDFDKVSENEAYSQLLSFIYRI